jgi:hypothetical protein
MENSVKVVDHQAFPRRCTLSAGMFCSAVGNARGKDIALRIANHLLKPLKEMH